MADVWMEDTLGYSVGGLRPYNEVRAQYFLTDVLGKRERIPLRFNLTEGCEEIDMCMRIRYGGAYKKDVATMLHNQLANSEEHEEIWGAWRLEYAAYLGLKANLAKLPKSSAEERIRLWNRSPSPAPTPQPTPESTPRRVIKKAVHFFPLENDFEQRVNNFLGSKVPIDLVTKPGKPEASQSIHVVQPTRSTPWERELQPTMRKLKKSPRFKGNKA